MLPHTSPRGSQNKAASPDLRSLQQMVGSVVNQVRQPKLLAPPYLFSQSTVAGITVFYIFGIGSSLWGAMLTKRLPLRTLVPMALTLMLLGLCATLPPDVRMILAGISLFTFGFFATHTLCSNWLATVVQAPKALVTAVYLCCYYLGASTLGALSGIGWDSGGWRAVVLLALLLSLAFALSLWLARQASRPQQPAPATKMQKSTSSQHFAVGPSSQPNNQLRANSPPPALHSATDEAYWQQQMCIRDSPHAVPTLGLGLIQGMVSRSRQLIHTLQLQRKFSDTNTGRDLTAIEHRALPVGNFSADALRQRHGLSLIHI